MGAIVKKKDPQIKLGSSEAIAITLIMIGSKVFLGYPRFVVELGLTAGWLVVVVAMLFSLGFWFLISSLLVRFPGKSLLEINKLVFGSLLGTGVNLLILSFIIVNTSVLLRLFCEAVIISALPDTPLSSLAFLFLLTMLYGAYLGLEAVSRSSYIAMPFILVVVVAVLLCLVSFWDFKQLLPLLGNGPGPLLFYGFLNTSAFGEVLILAIFTPYFSFEHKQIRKIGMFSIGSVGLYFIAITIVYLMVIPMPTALENLAPFYQMSRHIYLGRYFQRVESIFILFWIFTAFLRLSTGFLAVALITREILKIPYYRPILPALAILIFSLALTPANLMQAVVIEKYIQLYGWIITLLIPAGSCAVAVIRGKGKKNE